MRRSHARIWVFSALLAVAGCNSGELPTPTMNEIAEAFVKLVLAVGQYDADYVDAYFGPEEWRHEVGRDRLTLDQIRQRATTLRLQLDSMSDANEDTLATHRRTHLAKTLGALIARVDFLAGERRAFDEESAALFDAVAPSYSAEQFESILGHIDNALAGDGPLVDRLHIFKQDFVIPPQKLDAVFRAAVDACRQRTKRFIELPADESFVIEYVTDKSWSGYNWYEGDYRSLIQVNTDLPIYIDRALDLACHEGYPGHHVYNLLLERDLLRGRGWIEYSIYPLFSPRSLISEGTANFGIEMAFPAEERVRFETDVLFPLAGLDRSKAPRYYEIYGWVQRLSHAGNEAARRYLDGEIDATAAVAWLTEYALMSEDRARQRLAFIEQYRSYVINYNLGLDLVRSHIEHLGGTAENPDQRWGLFTNLLTNPYLPSQLSGDRSSPVHLTQ